MSQKLPEIAKTKEFKDREWKRKYIVKNAISFKLKHEWEVLVPRAELKDAEKMELAYKQKCLLLEKLMIDPKFDPDSEDLDGSELEQLYERLLVYFHLDFDLTEDEQQLLLNLTEENKTKVMQQIAISRHNDLKKKLSES